MPNLLVVGWLLLDVALLVGQVTLHRVEFALQPLLLPFALGQLIALSGWIAIGGRDVVVSQIGLLGVLLLWVLDTWDATGIGILVSVAAVLYLVLYGFLLNAPLIVARSRGWTFVAAALQQKTDSARFQMSLREMFVDTVLVAVVAALWTATRMGPSRSAGLTELWVRGLLAMVLVAFVIPWSVWACFWWIRPLRSGFVAALVAIIWGILISRLLGSSFYELVFGLVPAAVLIIHVVALQAAGFRFTQENVDYLEQSESVG